MAIQKKQLNDITIIRPFTILLLVVYHSFIIYNGGWSEPTNYTPISFYKWISKFSISFILEMFVFISGYLFAYQQIILKKTYTLKEITKKKFLRLIIPSTFFGIIYYSLFFQNDSFSFISFLYQIFNGIGHLWFLPMLFWCFIEGFLLNKLNLNNKTKLIFTLVLASVSFIPIPFQIGHSLYYLFYFYLGYTIFENSEKVLKWFVNIKSIILGIILFFILFITLSFWEEQLIKLETSNLFYKAIKHTLLNISKILYASVGVFTTYIIANYLLMKNNEKISQWIIYANSICFGVYIYQQFILQFIYYKTAFPISLGAYWLPIISFTITLVISIGLTVITLKTKLGKFLIG